MTQATRHGRPRGREQGLVKGLGQQKGSRRTVGKTTGLDGVKVPQVRQAGNARGVYVQFHSTPAGVLWIVSEKQGAGRRLAAIWPTADGWKAQLDEIVGKDSTTRLSPALRGRRADGAAS